MQTSHLHDQWAAPDNSRLTPKQFSLRFPVHIAAKIAALCEMYPHKNRTQIVADLLAAALDELEKSLPQALGEPIGKEDEHIQEEIAHHEGYDYEPLFCLGGPRGRFRHIANRHYDELEREMGNEGASVLYPEIWITESDLKR
jgi:hypothetical protein